MILEINDIERELLVCALEFWIERIDYETGAPAAHRRCGEFTRKRINELMAKLEEPLQLQGEDLFLNSKGQPNDPR
jgi:hypothetical protein